MALTAGVHLTLGSRTIPVFELTELHFSDELTNSSLPCTVLVITSRHVPHRKYRSSVAVQLLLRGPHRRHRSSVVQFSPVRNLLPSNRLGLQRHYLATGLRATQFRVNSRHVQHVDRDRLLGHVTIFGRSHRPIRKLYVKACKFTCNII
jgi:hypothetical protein